ncbi:MAG: glycoside hydrolase family 127 protein [Clostridia bacterium]|nr:glycoside hydrolase family 127 protein [Clostridia bacterium]
MLEADYRNVTITGGFFCEKQKLVDSATLDAVYDRFKETGRVSAFACRYKPGGKLPKPHPFWDSDVAKWIEAASYALGRGARPDLAEKIESIVDDIIANQWEDGYINSYYTAVEPENRFTRRADHELYCCGHLIEAAVAYYEATGRKRFLNAVCRYADLVDKVFRQEDSAAFSTPRHEEIELALFKLWRCTGEGKYKTLAEYFINKRGTNGKDAPGDSPRARAKVQDIPLCESETALGHCVCATYRLAGMADMAFFNGDKDLFARCEKIFGDIVSHKMYITGGIGSTYHGEAFTVPYDLPPEGAYTETCASAGMVLFCSRMLRYKTDSKYADVIESELYNGLLSGLSLDGRAFFYENPLEINLADRFRLTCTDESEHWQPAERKALFECACCPPNICRLLSGLGGYIYGARGGEVAVHQYVSSVYQAGGVRLEVQTDYPNSGFIKIIQSGVNTLKLRVPGWCEEFMINAGYRIQNGYAVIKDPAPEILLELKIEPRAVFPNPRIRAVSGRAALRRGPVVYCMESGDNGGLPPHMLRVSLPLKAKTLQNGFSGLPDLLVNGCALSDAKELYLSSAPKTRRAALKLIPYHAFANRGSDDMAVWLGVCGEKI